VDLSALTFRATLRPTTYGHLTSSLDLSSRCLPPCWALGLEVTLVELLLCLLSLALP
jgi:hypothetical protein